ncbi:MAG: hypothetical protein J0L87_06620 [Bacteroidetes bacterium]|nr:hypothetical protein [Bacteroidota bacterium]
MKKIILVTFLFMVSSVASLIAQNKAYFDSKTAKQKVNERTVSFTFDVDNISNDQQRLAVNDKFKKSIKNVTAVTSTLTASNKAKYVAVMIRENHKETLKTMLLAAGVQTIIVDGKEIKTTQLVEYLESLKKEK